MYNIVFVCFRLYSSNEEDEEVRLFVLLRKFYLIIIFMFILEVFTLYLNMNIIIWY